MAGAPNPSVDLVQDLRLQAKKDFHAVVATVEDVLRAQMPPAVAESCRFFAEMEWRWTLALISSPDDVVRQLSELAAALANAIPDFELPKFQAQTWIPADLAANRYHFAVESLLQDLPANLNPKFVTDKLARAALKMVVDTIGTALKDILRANAGEWERSKLPRREPFCCLWCIQFPLWHDQQSRSGSMSGRSRHLHRFARERGASGANSLQHLGRHVQQREPA